MKLIRLLPILVLFLSTQPLTLRASAAGDVPAALTPLLAEILKTKTPAQWTETIRKASPNAARIIEERSREPKPRGFTLADYEALPEKERKALLEVFTPIVTRAIGNLTLQQQVDVLASTPQFTADQAIAPIVNRALGLVR